MKRNDLESNLEIFCHLLLFEVKPDDEDKLYMVVNANSEMKRDAQREISDFLYQEELC
jgi:hypothetical protein